MPWDNLKNVPPQVRTHQGIKLTLAQANKWAEIYDAIKDDKKFKNPIAAAWSTWEKIHIIKNEKWTENKDDDKSAKQKKSLDGKKKYMSSVIMEAKMRDYKVEKDAEGKRHMTIYGIATTTAVSNWHRFPVNVLKRDIGTLIGQPLVEGHSDFPWGGVRSKDVLGQVNDAWYVEAKERAEFIADTWNENFITFVEKMKHRVKFSVAWEHDYEIDDDGIAVSTEVSFDHLGFTDSPADEDSILLSAKEKAEQMGVMMKSSNGFLEIKNTRGEKVTEEEIVSGEEVAPESEEVEEEPAPPVNSEVVEGETPPAEEVSETPAEDEDVKDEKETPPAEEVVDETDPKTESGVEGKEAALEVRMKTIETERDLAIKEKEDAVKKLAEYEAESKKSDIIGYVDKLINVKVKVPAQKDELVEHYMSFSSDQMAQEVKINKVSVELTGFFKSVGAVTEETDAKAVDFKEPNRKFIS